LSIALSIEAGILVLHRLDVRPRTSDAIVTANTIQVAPEVVGRIATLNVKDDAVVHKGDVLFTIEQERYALTVAQSRAQVQALEAQINLTNRTVSSQVTAVSVAKANAEAVRARLKQATATLFRMEPLGPDGYVTSDQMDKARTARATAESELSAALSATQQSRQAIGDAKSLVAQLDGARALVGLAERDLRNTVMRAPFDGRIVGVGQQGAGVCGSAHLRDGAGVCLRPSRIREGGSGFSEVRSAAVIGHLELGAPRHSRRTSGHSDASASVGDAFEPTTYNYW
jgi:multidrug efflux system membrane fusion protein